MSGVLKHVKIVLGAPRVMILEKKKIPENFLIVTCLLRAGCYNYDCGNRHSIELPRQNFDIMIVDVGGLGKIPSNH